MAQQQEKARRQPHHRQQQRQQQQQQQGHPESEQPPMHNPTFHLRVSRKEAAKELLAAAKIGQAIRGQRVRDMRDLDEARREKQEWHSRTMEMLARIVSTEAWCEEFNDYVARILPEYAEFGMFVDIFEEEMRHRLGKLQALYKELVNVPEPGPLQPHAHAHRAGNGAGASAGAGAAGRAEIAQVLDGAPQAHQDEDAYADDSTADADETAGAPFAAGESDDPEPQLETIYQPPEATMPQVQQQQQQQQLQQQQQQPPRQTVAASILHDPAHPPRPSSASGASSASSTSIASGGQTCGALIARTNDEPAAQAIAQFLQKLNVVIRVIDRTAPTPDAPLIDQLHGTAGARFVLMLVDANSAGTASGDDLFDLGCCVGRMGPDRVFALHRGGDATPDRYGIAHVPLDDTEGWQLQLARLLKKAGVSVDLNKLM